MEGRGGEGRGEVAMKSHETESIIDTSTTLVKFQPIRLQHLRFQNDFATFNEVEKLLTY